MTGNATSLGSAGNSDGQVVFGVQQSHSLDRSMEKCDNCRHRKKKCLPEGRVWPADGKCGECTKARLECGPNTRSQSRSDTGALDLDDDDDLSTVRPRPIASQISDAQWNQIKDSFENFYIEEAKPLKEVMKIMQDKHKFKASRRQYHGKIVKWGLHKYKKPTDSRNGTPSHTSSPALHHADPVRRSVSSVEPGEPTQMRPPQRRVPHFNFDAASFSIPKFGFGGSPLQQDSAQSQHIRDTFVLVPQLEGGNVYYYTPLPNPHDIRLLRLLPGHWTEPIGVELFVTDINRADEYAALSWVWGQDTELENITINNLDCQIRKTLDTALRYLRYEDMPRTLWVDAICINQEDAIERSRQLQIMTGIYSDASEILAWLGPETAESSAAIEFAQKIVSMDYYEDLTKISKSFSAWEAFRDMLRMSWFRRRWVVQEVTLAKTCIIHWGRDLITWSDLVDAFEVVMTFEEDTAITSTTLGRDYNFFDELKQSSVMQLVSVTKMIARRDKLGEVVEFHLSLEVLLYKCRFLDTIDVRDQIYSLLPLCNLRKPDDSHRLIAPAQHVATPMADTPSSVDTGAESIDHAWPVIDYHKSISTLCLEVVEHVVKLSESIDIICRPWAPSSLGHPTWICSLDQDSFRVTRNGVYTRFRADALVGDPAQVSKSYNASKNTRAKFGLREGMLIVRGFLLDKIRDVASTAIEGCIPADWLTLGASGWDATTMLPPDSFWRTLVADRGSTGKDTPPSFFARACQWAFRQIVRGGDLNTKEMLREPKCPPYIAPFLRRMQSVIWKRRLFVTNKGYIGIGSEKIQAGDDVQILLGCSVPVVLRQTLGGKSQYNLMGDCYIDGMMNGEVFRHEPSFSEIYLR